eukprot:TRINITY_DN101204_c0_g1_i1.p1 TRINITY_DN101204_c0_g1~~TRINITY_DN101204_c0_g1_i1.p1  ORF type:complete len:538 (+),score=76.37 TRINITY_DN101204_c0_g1_i1:88-1701(+)
MMAVDMFLTVEDPKSSSQSERLSVRSALTTASLAGALAVLAFSGLRLSASVGDISGPLAVIETASTGHLQSEAVHHARLLQIFEEDPDSHNYNTELTEPLPTHVNLLELADDYYFDGCVEMDADRLSVVKMFAALFESTVEPDFCNHFFDGDFLDPEATLLAREPFSEGPAMTYAGIMGFCEFFAKFMLSKPKVHGSLLRSYSVGPEDENGVSEIRSSLRYREQNEGWGWGCRHGANCAEKRRVISLGGETLFEHTDAVILKIKNRKVYQMVWLFGDPEVFQNQEEPHITRGFKIPVTGTDHDSGTDGKFFNFNWPAGKAIPRRSEVKVLSQCRNGKLIWTGKVRMSPTVEGGATGSNSHGRRKSGAAAGQFEAGDILISSGSCKEAMASSPEVAFAEQLMKSLMQLRVDDYWYKLSMCRYLLADHVASSAEIDARGVFEYDNDNSYLRFRGLTGFCRFLAHLDSGNNMEVLNWGYYQLMPGALVLQRRYTFTSELQHRFETFLVRLNNDHKIVSLVSIYDVRPKPGCYTDQSADFI